MSPGLWGLSRLIVSDLYSTVEYAPELVDDSWTSYAEAAADVCRAPGRWVAAELWGGGKKVVITSTWNDEVYFDEKSSDAESFKRVVRFVAGLALSVFGNLLAIPFMAVAYLNEEIRLKHRVVYQMQNDLKVAPEDYARLNELVEERQRLAKERQGCEPISCLLLSICCMLCYLVCKSNQSKN